MSSVRTPFRRTAPAAPRKIGPANLMSERHRWQAYEAAKRQWEDANPGASSREHEAAMQELARKAGV